MWLHFVQLWPLSFATVSSLPSLRPSPLTFKRGEVSSSFYKTKQTFNKPFVVVFFFPLLSTDFKRFYGFPLTSIEILFQTIRKHKNQFSFKRLFLNQLQQHQQKMLKQQQQQRVSFAFQSHGSQRHSIFMAWV